MARFLFAGFLLTLAGALARADLSPEASKPYRFQVVLHMTEHPFFTDVFRDKVKRELHDSLQAALGDLARVEVVTDHPRLQEVLARGLIALSPVELPVMQDPSPAAAPKPAGMSLPMA